jgi:serine/threonine protein kinase
MLTESTAMSDPRYTGRPTAEGTVLRDRFVIEERLEHGRFGSVFRALDRQRSRDDGVSRYVAILVLPAEMLRNARQIDAFKREFSAAQSLSHEHLVQLYDLDRDGDVHFVVMEWVDGESLRNVVDCLAPELLSEEEALTVVSSVGEALLYAHANGLLHGDVRADNVIVTERGDVKLLLTSACLARSAPFPVEQRDDVRGLAGLAYELLSGAPPPAPPGAPRSDKSLEPDAVRSLSRAHSNALRAALTSQEGRTRTVQEFLTAMELSGRPAARRQPKTAAYAPPRRSEPPLEPVEHRDYPRSGDYARDHSSDYRGDSSSDYRSDSSRDYRSDFRSNSRSDYRNYDQNDDRNDHRRDYRSEYGSRYRPGYEEPPLQLQPARPRNAGVVNRLLRRSAAAIAIMVALVAAVAGALYVGRDGFESLTAAWLAPADPAGGVGAEPDRAGQQAAAPSRAPSPPGPVSATGADGRTSADEALLTVPPSGADPHRRPTAPSSQQAEGSSQQAEGREPPEQPGAAEVPAARAAEPSERGSVLPGTERAPESPAVPAASTDAVRAAPGSETAPAGARLSFDPAEVVATEGQGVVPVEIRRSDDRGDMSFVWWTTDGTATAPDDYADLGRIVETFRPGERRRTIFIPITADSLPESTEHFFVNLSELSERGTQRGELMRITVTIIDDDN